MALAPAQASLNSLETKLIVPPSARFGPVATGPPVSAASGSAGRVKVARGDWYRVPSAVEPWTRKKYVSPGCAPGRNTSWSMMPVPFMARLLLKLPRASVSPQTIAQMAGSVVTTRKIPRSGSSGSTSKTNSESWISENGRTSPASVAS